MFGKPAWYTPEPRTKYLKNRNLRELFHRAKKRRPFFPPRVIHVKPVVKPSQVVVDTKTKSWLTNRDTPAFRPRGKVINDPVYKTPKALPSALQTTGRKWETSGRSLLTMALGVLEGTRLTGENNVRSWRSHPPCGARCTHECGKSRWRAVCAWRCRDHYKLSARLDSLLMQHKGELPRIGVNINHPFARAPTKMVPFEAAANSCGSLAMRWCPKTKLFLKLQQERSAFESLDSEELDRGQCSVITKQYPSSYSEKLFGVHQTVWKV